MAWGKRSGAAMHTQEKAILEPTRVKAGGGSQGETQASVWEHFRNRLKRFASAHMDNRISARVDASDVVQEVYLQAVRQEDELAEVNSSGQFRILKKMVAGHAIDYFRRHVRSARRSVTREMPSELSPSGEPGRPLRDELASDTSSPYEKAFRHETLELVRVALRRLSPADQRLLKMRHIQQLSVTEIAHRLNTSRTAVTTRHCRAIRRLRRILEAGSQAEQS